MVLKTFLTVEYRKINLLEFIPGVPGGLVVRTQLSARPCSALAGELRSHAVTTEFSKGEQQQTL